MSKQNDTSTMIDIRKLGLINKLGRLGTNGVADNLGMLAGDEARMEVKKTSFVEAKDIGKEVDGGRRVGIRVRLRDTPGGHILVLFPEASARTATKLMLADMRQDSSQVSSEMAQSAVKELGNMMVSGFIDGWADVLNTSIDVSTPQLVYASANDIVERTAGLGEDRLALIFDSTIDVPSTRIDVEIYAFPDTEQFVSMIRRINT